MKSPPDLIVLEVELLLAKYGMTRLIAALALAQNREPDELYMEIKRFKDAPKKAKKSAPDLDAIIRNAASIAPAKNQALQSLLLNFRNKTLFPQLRDIQEFVSRKSGRTRNFKSRSDAAAPLFHILSEADLDELDRLNSLSRTASKGDLHTISQGILNRK